MKNTKMQMTISDVNQYVIDLEREYRLFDQTIDGIYFWKSTRFFLSRQIEIGRNTLEPPKKLCSGKPLLQRLMRFVRSFDHCYRNPRVLLYEHSRKVKHRSSYIDPYSWRVTRALENAEIDVCLLENDLYYQCDLWDTRRWFLFADHVNRARFARLDQLPRETESLVHTLEKRILSDWEQTVDLKSIVRSAVNKFRRDYAYFSAALRNKSPEILFVVCGYGKEGIVQAAKDAGVYTVELQHGTIYPHHLGYTYPGWNKIPYFSDSLAVYADAWLDGVSLGGIDVKVIGYESIAPVEIGDQLREKTIDILFISQWTHSEKILQLADDTAKRMPDRTVVCKLHPSDIFSAEIAARYPNIKIEKDGLLCEYLRAARYTATVFSTGIFESLQYNCRPILLNMHGVQHMESFARITGAPVLGDAEEMAAFLQKDGDGRFEYRDLQYKSWFADFDESAILDYLERRGSR